MFIYLFTYIHTYIHPKDKEELVRSGHHHYVRREVQALKHFQHPFISEYYGTIDIEYIHSNIPAYIHTHRHKRMHTYTHTHLHRYIRM